MGHGVSGLSHRQLRPQAEQLVLERSRNILVLFDLFVAVGLVRERSLKRQHSGIGARVILCT